MDKFFAFFGKAILVIVIVGGLAGGGYYLGRSGKLNFGAPAPAPEAVTTSAPTLTPMPTSVTREVTAGLGAESGLSFTKYTIDVPEGWTPNRVTTSEGTWVDTLTITNGTYQIKIFQAATGGALCLYPGDPDFEGPSSRYEAFVELTTKDGILLRRGGGTKGFTLCQKNTENFGQPTVFGHASYITPVTPDTAIVKQMDEMITSLKKID